MTGQSAKVRGLSQNSVVTPYAFRVDKILPNSQDEKVKWITSVNSKMGVTFAGIICFYILYSI